MVKRSSVIVYGDPHMIPYKATKSVTCPALGWNTYLTNEFFLLEAFAEPAANNSDASYVTEV